MRRMQVEIPDELAAKIDALVAAGRFASDVELTRFALIDFLRRNRFELTEQFQREDIAWALRQRESKV